MVWLDFLPRVTQGWNQGFSRAVYLSGAWSPLPSSRHFWKNLVPCGCRSEVPVFLLAVIQGLLSTPKVCTQILTWKLTSSKPEIEFIFFFKSLKPGYQAHSGKFPFWWSQSLLIRNLNHICKISFTIWFKKIMGVIAHHIHSFCSHPRGVKCAYTHANLIKRHRCLLNSEGLTWCLMATFLSWPFLEG